jgi:hypothetical protein
MDAMAIGAAGMNAASQQFDASAARTVGGGDPTKEIVSQIAAKTDFAASAKVVQTADQMLGTVLNMKV